MVKQATNLPSALASILGDADVLPANRVADFAVDGLVPQVAVAPPTVETVAEVLRYAHAEGLGVIPWGGGTMMHVGNIPRRYDIALSLSRLNAILEHEPADLTVTCQGGITLAGLQRHLAAHGQLVPMGPPFDEGPTIGGILATNASGPWRHAYGSARDFTIGMKVVTADGRITKAGGKVVKNVAGYDLCKLYIGSLGTLGLIVEATFKLAPIPGAERSAIACFESPAQACAFAAELHRRGLSLRALQLLNPAAASSAGLTQNGLYAVLLDLAGSPAAVERSRREIGEVARTAAADLIEVDGDACAAGDRMRLLVSAAGPALLGKACVLPSRIPALLEALDKASVGAPGHSPLPYVLAWPTIGIAYARWDTAEDATDLVTRLRTLAAEMGGSVIVEACPPELKQRIDVFGDPPPSFELMRRVKERFDPKGILNPGRFVGRL